MLSASKSLLLTDDHAVVRKGILACIQNDNTTFKIYEAADFAGMKQLLQQRMVSHLILDLKTPDCSLMEPLGFVRQEYPEMAVMIFTATPFAMIGNALLKARVAGYLSKQATAHETTYGINYFLNYGSYWPANIRKKNDHDPCNPFSSLSERELIVTGHLLNGLMVKQIAIKLSISTTAVSTYKARVFNKLKVDSLMDVGQMASIFSFPV